MPKFQLHPVRASAIILILFSLGFSIYSFANAWVEPGTTPPGGNVAAPLHTGTTSQTKQGFLTAYGVEGYYPGNGAYGALGYFGWGGYFNGGVYTNSSLIAMGNVGIGTANPGRILHVYQNTNGTSVVKMENVASGTAALAGFDAFVDGGAIAGVFRQMSESYTTSGRYIAGSLLIEGQGTGGITLNALHASGPIRFMQQSSEKMRIDNTGNVGIGTVSPTGTLTVKAGNNDWDGGIDLFSSDGSRKFMIHPEISAGYGLMFYGAGQGFSFYGGDVRVKDGNNFCLNGDCRSSWPATNLGDWYFSGDNFVSNGWGHIYTSSSNLHLDSYSGEMYLNYYYNNWVNMGNGDTGYLRVGDSQIYDDNNWFHIYSGANNRIYTNSYLRVDNGLEVNGRIYSNEWIQMNNYSGLYSPKNDGAHFYPNNGSYGSWRVAGYKNNWYGLEFDTAAGQTSLMVGTTGQGWGSQITGFHNNSYGWLWRFDHSTLAVGNVPIARIPDIGSAYVHYAAYGRNVYDNGAYSGVASWREPSDLGVRYANTAGSAGSLYNVGGYYAIPSGVTVLNVVYANQYNCMSDLELKKDIKPIGNALDKVFSIKGVSFTWKDEEMGAGNQVGVIAQDVEKVLPEVVTTNEQGLKAVDYSKLTPLIIESIKDLKIEKDQDVGSLREKIDNLEANERAREEIINDLKRRIEALEKR